LEIKLGLVVSVAFSCGVILKVFVFVGLKWAILFALLIPAVSWKKMLARVIVSLEAVCLLFGITLKLISAKVRLIEVIMENSVRLVVWCAVAFLWGWFRLLHTKKKHKFMKT
jgi:hypothetical protein